MQELVRVVAEVADHEVDEASGSVWAAVDAGGGAGTAGIEEQPGPDGLVRLLVSLPAPLAPLVIEALGSRWPAEEDGTVSSEPWLDAWRGWARPVQVGRIVVRPSWLGDDEAETVVGGTVVGGDVVVQLDPGRAFGSGAHPTTRLVLGELQQLDLAGRRLLDVGCGSGVLAVAAALLGSGPVTGVDVDPEARAATVANAATNGVAGLVSVPPVALGELDGRYDVVVANIGAAVLVDLAGPLVARLAPGAAVVLSGVLAEQAGEVVAGYAAAGVDLAATSDEEGWVALSGRGAR